MATTRCWFGVAFLIVWMVGIFLYIGGSSTNLAIGQKIEGSQLEQRLDLALIAVESLKESNKKLRDLLAKVSDEKLSVLSDKMDALDTQVDAVETQMGDRHDEGQGQDASAKVIAQLRAQLKDLRVKVNSGGEGQSKVGSIGSDSCPVESYEKGRRRVEWGVQEFWMAIKGKLNAISNPVVKSALSQLSHQHKTVLADLSILGDSGQDWKDEKMAHLQDLMQRRLHSLQNPADCTNAKKLLCDVNKGCGYGCQLHHAAYCMMIAYGTERTLILQSKGWKYNPKGWETVFQPLSETCLEAKGSQAPWKGVHESKDVQVVTVPIVDMLHNRPPYLPLGYPRDLSSDLEAAHGDPSVWFVGQFVKYLTRPQLPLVEDLKAVEGRMGFHGPIVGIHIRRTDKVGTEAAFHGIDEYMVHVKDYYERKEVEKQARAVRTGTKAPKEAARWKVYVASDDPTVLVEARKKYPDFEFLGDVQVAKSASMGTRFSTDSLRGVLLDIHFLSKTDFLVCTFSSQVCRVAYEMMQTMHTDASDRFKSLDDIYYFGGQGGHQEDVIYPHSPDRPGELTLDVGDTVGIAGNHWDGQSKGKNTRTGGIGLYPSYKTLDKKVLVEYPTYPGV